jgi:hypothetical protein
VVVAWQGGEPTMMGLDFFRRSVELERTYAAPGQRVLNTIQTNGSLPNDERGRFPHTHHYQVTSTGLRHALFLTRVHDRILQTGLAELTGPNPAPRKAATMHQAAIDDRERRLSASSPASGSSVNLTTCCSASGRPPMAPGSADPRTAAGRPLTCTLNCWPPSRTPPLSASANFAPRPLRRPAGARCSST